MYAHQGDDMQYDLCWSDTVCKRREGLRVERKKHTQQLGRDPCTLVIWLRASNAP